MRTNVSVIHTIVFFLAAVVVVFFANPAVAVVYAPSIQSLATTVTTLTKARNNIVLQHRKAVMNEAELSSEEDDLRVFISYLDGRIYYYCEQLYNLGGVAALSDTPCPTDGDGALETTRFTTIPVTPPETSEDRLSNLESSFSESLGSFDDMLLEEQQKVASATPKQQETSGNSGHDRFESENGRESPGESAGKGSSKRNSSNSGSAQNGNTSRNETTVAAGTAGNSGTGVGSTKQSQTPPTAGNKDLSQTDDDIIAKQLKEAAEQETDPEVKEKLWEEYRKYKEGIR